MSELLIVNKEDMIEIADAVRSQTGTSEGMTITDIKNRIYNLAPGDGGGINWEDINNKPFYEEEGVIEHLPMTTYNDFIYNPEFGVFIKTITKTFNLTAGEKYHVSWDDEVFECEATDVSAMMPNSVAIGNLKAFNSSWPGNNEPFIIFTNEYANFVSLTDTQAGITHNIRVWQEVILTKTLDKKYLPIPFFGEGEETVFEIFGQPNEEGIFVNNVSKTLIPGQTYEVSFNGEIYKTDCIEATDHVYFLGNPLALDLEDNGMPFAAISDPKGQITGSPIFMVVPVVLSEDDNYEIIIKGLAQTKIDKKFLFQPDWSENNPNGEGYIANRPFSEIPAGTQVVPLKTVTAFVQEEGKWYAATEKINLVWGRSYTITIDDVTWTETIQSSQIISPTGDYGLITNYNNVNSLILLPSGGEHTYKIVLNEDIITKIDSKFIPDIEALPSATTADNGKFLRVVNGIAAWSTVPSAESNSF